ncbi:MAG: flagellar basal-body rod protein FlgF [Acidobacteria bacterium]|nr:flagellar basal-body rod protein FlgF [Acidobacteriota bacterium]
MIFLAYRLRHQKCNHFCVDVLLSTAASGLRARTEALELVANNIANANTAGYKADREFHSTYVAPEAMSGPEGTLPAVSPLVESNWIDFGHGVSITTGNPLDVAISGNGFFVVEGVQGRLYTRNGNFQTGTDGTLVTQTGEKVLGQNGKPILLVPREAVQISPDGGVRQGAQLVGRLATVDFEDRQGLRKAGGTYFRWDESNGAPTPVSAPVEQGRLESANIQPAESAVRLVNIMRQFETLQRAIALGNEMNRHAVEEVAKL